MSRVRGRIDHLRTETKMLLSKGKVACSFEELSLDTPRNRFVRSALLRLSSLVSDRSLGAHCASLAARLWEAGVTGEAPEERRMGNETFGRNDQADRQMVFLARLAYNLALPAEEQGTHTLASPCRDEYWVRRLFERAIGGFYAQALDKRWWKVRTGIWLQWPLTSRTDRIVELFPAMKTDIIVDDQRSTGRIIIDTKFTEIVRQGHYKESSFKNEYIYQMYAYLRSQESDDDPPSLAASGILLHPSLGEDYDESVELQGHALRFVTVDLTTSAMEIRQRLIHIVGKNGAVSYT